MRYDEHLNPVLKKCSNEELEILISFFIDRFSESLSTSDEYEKYYPNHRKYYHIIADEIMRYGGHSIVNFFRDGGPEYKEIVCDTADMLDINFNRYDSIDNIEKAILEQVFEDEWEQMLPENQKEMLNSFNINDYSVIGSSGKMALKFFIKKSGFFLYKYSVILANKLSRMLFNHGLSLSTNAMITSGIKSFSFISPLNTITWLYSIINSLSAPSYKVIVPSVIYIASLRMKYNYPSKLFDINYYISKIRDN